MELVRNLILIVMGVILVLLVLGWLGLQIKPQSFAEYAEKSPELKTMPLPGGLPAPVERFYQAVYGEEIPLIETVVIQGRAVIRPVMNIPFPARFVFVHNAGRDYRHYIEATLFGMPLLKVNEGYVDGKSFFESPMGTYYDDPNTNQGANLALWAEGSLVPVIVADRCTRPLGSNGRARRRGCTCHLSRARRVSWCASIPRRGWSTVWKPCATATRARANPRSCGLRAARRGRPYQAAFSVQ